MIRLQVMKLLMCADQPQARRPHHDAAQNITRYMRQLQQFGHPAPGKSRQYQYAHHQKRAQLARRAHHLENLF
jgi:hypothetical protein